MKASVFCIGTELVDGQIINRNAPWISKKLKDRGIQTTFHLVVPDERQQMREGLELCARESDLIFVTGGLGPTSDDFTRDVVAEWMQQPLEFHDASWTHLSERLTSRGYSVKEIQRQQCFFPRGSEVLFNSHGTANAFFANSHGKKVFVLPGPPREIEAVWDSYIDAWLEKNTTHIDPIITRMWDTMGLGESDIAVIVEQVLTGLDVEKGYRVHLPYVEVKLSYKKSDEPAMLPWVEKITMALASHTVCRDGTDVAALFAKRVETISSLHVVDLVTGSFLLNRLTPVLRGYMGKNFWHFANVERSGGPACPAEVVLRVSPLEPFKCELSLESKGQKVTEVIQSPYSTANMHERSLQYFAEKALIFWQQTLP